MANIKQIMNAAVEIQECAANPVGTSAIAFELTDQQSISIALRAKQLRSEKIRTLGRTELKRQIDVCYRQRGR